MYISRQYLAGFFDSAGIACIRKNSNKKSGNFIRAELYIANTNIEILRAIQNQYGGQIRHLSAGNGHAKPVDRLYWSSLDSIETMVTRLYPNTITMKPQLALMKGYLRRHKSNRRARFTTEDWKIVEKFKER